MISRLLTICLETKNFADRTLELCKKAARLKKGDLALASELCISGYQDMGALKFVLENLSSHLAKGAYLGLSSPIDGFNEFVLLGGDNDRLLKNSQTTFCATKDDEILRDFAIYRQKKAILFSPNSEDQKFKSGKIEDIQVFKHSGVKIGVLICFELRFCELWTRLKGADIILVPAMWAEERKRHFETLCLALALQNRCYVVACSDLDLRFSKVFAPDGKSAKSMSFDPNFSRNFKNSLGIDENTIKGL